MFYPSATNNTLGLKSAVLSRDATCAWSNSTTCLENQDTFSWEDLTQAIEELPVDLELQDRLQGYRRRAVLGWFTMRLEQTFKNEFSKPNIEDQCIKDRITALGSCLKGTPQDSLIKHAVQVSRLLHRLHYPELLDIIHGTGALLLEELRWVWMNTSTVLDLYGPLTSSMGTSSTEHTTHKDRCLTLKKFLSQCWSDIADLSLSTSAAISSESLRAILKVNATRYDIWSMINIAYEKSSSNQIKSRRRDYFGALETMNIMFRVIAHEIQSSNVSPSFPLMTPEMCEAFWNALCVWSFRTRLNMESH
jgi:hypothetical protein